VDRTGSIKQAVASLGKGYRHVWTRIKEAEASLGGILVETRRGCSGPQLVS
jgi:molybdate transport system regulatory protein